MAAQSSPREVPDMIDSGPLRPMLATHGDDSDEGDVHKDHWSRRPIGSRDPPTPIMPASPAASFALSRSPPSRLQPLVASTPVRAPASPWRGSERLADAGAGADCTPTSDLSQSRSDPYLWSTRARMRTPASRATTRSLVSLSDGPHVAVLSAIASTTPLDQTLSPSDLRRAEIHWRELVQEKRNAQERLLGSSADLVRARESLTRAGEAYRRSDYNTAVKELSTSIGVHGRCDQLFRLRARAQLHAGSLEQAVSDSRSAAKLAPRSADNLLLFGGMCLRDGALTDAGRAYTTAMGLDASGQRGEDGYGKLLGTIRGRRYFWQTQVHRAPPRIFDSRVEISDPALDSVAHMQLNVPGAPATPVVVDVGLDFVELSWAEPDEDGGDEVFQFVLECSWYEVTWSNQLQALFDGMREFTPWHTGPAKVLSMRFDGLTADTPHAFRVKCSNSVGDSAYSNVVNIRTRTPATKDREEKPTPPEWLACDYADIVAAHVQAEGVDGGQVLGDLGDVLQEYAQELHLAFKLFCVLGSKDVTNVTEMQRPQFNKLLRDAGLLKDGFLTQPQADLIFQRANMDFRGDAKAKDKGADEDGGADAMVESEFVNGLVRAADYCFGGAPEVTRGLESLPDKPLPLVSLDSRVDYFLKHHLMPAVKAGMPGDDFLQMVKSRRTRAILAKHAKVLKHIFTSYAAADISSAEAREAADSVNMSELLFMVKEGGMLDKNLSVAKVAFNFTIVNIENAVKSAEQLLAEGIPPSANVEDADDEEDELCYEEWCDVLVRMTNDKFPEAQRGNTEFPLVLDEYLEVSFIPKFTQIIKDKKRGIGSKHI